MVRSRDHRTLRDPAEWGQTRLRNGIYTLLDEPQNKVGCVRQRGQDPVSSDCTSSGLARSFFPLVPFYSPRSICPRSILLLLALLQRAFKQLAHTLSRVVLCTGAFLNQHNRICHASRGSVFVHLHRSKRASKSSPYITPTCRCDVVPSF